MLDGSEVLGHAELAKGHRVVEDEARAADEMACARVVDRAVVFEEVKETAGRIDAARMIERHRLLDVAKQELATAEIGRGGYAHGTE